MKDLESLQQRILTHYCKITKRSAILSQIRADHVGFAPYITFTCMLARLRHLDVLLYLKQITPTNVFPKKILFWKKTF